MKSTRSQVIIIVGYVTDRSRNQFKQLINEGFYLVDGSAISNTEKEWFYSNTRLTKKSTALWVRSRCFGG